MICGYQLFGRDAFTSKEKRLLKEVQRRARDLYYDRYNQEVYALFGIPPEFLTLPKIESYIVKEALKEHDLEKRKS